MFLLLVSLVVVTVFFTIGYYQKKMRPMYEKAANIPGPKTFPIIGNALQFGTNTKGSSTSLYSSIFYSVWPENKYSIPKIVNRKNRLK